MTEPTGPIDPAVRAALAALPVDIAADQPPPAPVDPAMLARWAGRLPDALLSVWQHYGLITLAGGRLHLIDPARLAPILAYIIEDDPDLDGDTHAIAYGDLGEVVVWSARWGFGFLSPVLLALTVPGLTSPAQSGLVSADGDTGPRPPGLSPAADAQFVRLVLRMPPEMIEAFDPAQAPVHDRVAERLGPLPPGFIYGTPVAPPPLGGTPAEAFVPAELTEWLEGCYGNASVSLSDWDRDPPTQRLVGAAGRADAGPGAAL